MWYNVYNLKCTKHSNIQIISLRNSYIKSDKISIIISDITYLPLRILSFSFSWQYSFTLFFFVNDDKNMHKKPNKCNRGIIVCISNVQVWFEFLTLKFLSNIKVDESTMRIFT